MRQFYGSALVCCVLMVGGCAHPLVIGPDVTKIERTTSDQPKVAKKVGYVISEKELALEVTSPGGGGDSIRYFPYRDIEPAFAKMLSNVFDGVTRLKAMSDADKASVSYVISPSIVTNSSGDGHFTWPPTRFTVDLTSNIRDSSGTLIANPRVVGEGQAAYADFFTDKGIAAIRAMADALLKMQQALLEIRLADPTSVTRAPLDPKMELRGESVRKRLEDLKDLSDRGLINQDDYERKKKEVLDSI